MRKVKKYDIFISYRRQGGEATARILCERLTDMGYKVFFDVESLRSGDFNRALYEIIDECNDFLLILSPQALDRCANQDDWVRNEISYALEKGKNIVPVLLRGFQFPSDLSPNIAAIRHQNGIEASTEFFDAFIQKLRGFLATKPSLAGRIVQNTLFKRTLPFLLAFMLISGGIFGAVTVYNKTQNVTFPATQTEKNVTKEFLMVTGEKLLKINNLYGLEKICFETCEAFLADEKATSLEYANAEIEHALTEMQKTDTADGFIDANLSNKLDATPIDKSAVTAFAVAYQVAGQEAADRLCMLQFVINDPLYDTATKRKILNLYVRQQQASGKYTLCIVNSIVLPIEKSFLKDFYNSITLLTALPIENYTWLEEEDAIERQADTQLNLTEDTMNELAMVIGNQNTAYTGQLAAFRQQLKQDGFSDEEIEEQVAQLIKSAAGTGG
ncbi:MAG: toll/interleukin-1 receptor domain-containing protein [Oscillospiraceae bacterium]|nr:toll/interleukin-1 receptor domain-containing protein [Oscillospiraceae bacterium]